MHSEPSDGTRQQRAGVGRSGGRHHRQRYGNIMYCDVGGPPSRKQTNKQRNALLNGSPNRETNNKHIFICNSILLLDTYLWVVISIVAFSIYYPLQCVIIMWLITNEVATYVGAGRSTSATQVRLPPELL